MAEVETGGSLLYLYGVVAGDAPEPPAELRGVEDAVVRLLRMEPLAALVSEVPAERYVDEALDARLEDLDWVGARGLAHERVLDWYAERGPVVPMSLFSLHRDEARLRERLDEDAPRLEALLRELRGRREWGVKLWRHDAELAARIAELSPALQALDREIESAPQGRAFLLGRKREALQADEARRISSRIAHTVVTSLQESADRLATVPLPASAPQGGRALLLHAAVLVADDHFAAFQRRLSELAHEFQPYGFRFEFTGPWPPYHFVDAHGR